MQANVWKNLLTLNHLFKNSNNLVTNLENVNKCCSGLGVK